MSDNDKILLLEKILAKASRQLEECGYAHTFFLLEDFYPFYSVGTNEFDVRRMNDSTKATFCFTVPLHGNYTFEKCTSSKFSMKHIINYWKKTKAAAYEDALLQIVYMMEHDVADGWSIVLKPYTYASSTMTLWNAHVPIQQVALELDLDGV